MQRGAAVGRGASNATASDSTCGEATHLEEAAVAPDDLCRHKKEESEGAVVVNPAVGCCAAVSGPPSSPLGR